MSTKVAILCVVALVALSAAVGLVLPRLIPAAPRQPPLIGGLYSVDNSDGGYRIVKLLAVDERAFHVRLYGNHFPTRPTHLQAAQLSLTPDAGYAGPGFAHLAVTRRMFATWKPRLVEYAGPPTAEELEGSDAWARDPGQVLGE